MNQRRSAPSSKKQDTDPGRVSATKLSRRSVLRSAGAAGVVATTGLVGFSSGGVQVASATGDVFREVRSNWEDLIIVLSGIDSADSVSLLDPDGQQLVTASPSLGEHSVRVPLLPDGRHSRDDPYEPGHYTAVAFDDQNTELAELSFDIEPEVAVSGFESRWGRKPFVNVANHGSGPVQIRTVGLVDGPPDGTTSSRESIGITPPLRTIPAGTSVPILLDDAFVSDSREDVETTLGESFEFVFELETSHGESVTETIEVAYEGGIIGSETGIPDGSFAAERISGGDEVFEYE